MRWILTHGLVGASAAASAARRSKAQLPSLRRDEEPTLAAVGLAAGLGLVVFNNGDERAWFKGVKGGHDNYTGNFLLCLERGPQKGLFPHVAERLLGPTRMPWRWEYGSTVP